MKYKTNPSGHRGVLSCKAHQVTQEGVGPHETEPDVGGFGPFLECLGVGEVISSWTAIDQRYHNLQRMRQHSQWQIWTFTI